MANAPLETGAAVAPAVHSKPTGAPKTPERTPGKTQQDDEFLVEWGFDLDTLYKMAKQFFCQNVGKAFHVSYEDKTKLVAYTQQVKHGVYDNSKITAVGYLDVIGQDRHDAWLALGDMDATTAKQEFVALLHDRCPLFRPFVCAHKASLQQQEQIQREPQQTGGVSSSPSSTASSPIHNSSPNEELIRAALNQQTFGQFTAYAAQQYPQSPEHQHMVIKQLQEEHFKQYMRQLAEQTAALSLNGHRNQSGPAGEVAPGEAVLHSELPSSTVTTHCTEIPENDERLQPYHEHHNHGTTEVSDNDSDEDGSLISVAEPTMWTRKEIVEFKEDIREEGGDSIIKVGHGETVTVRVPTHADGQCLYWEFATDTYDIAFGVYFEWNKTPGNTVSVHISDSEDESGEEEDDTTETDIEAVKPAVDLEPPSSIIIPIYRRDCHHEVYVGRHQYPGQGIYLLKFDNSYSLWRGKTLYYRVYYTR
ncbi:Golgi resident protein GCP60 [Galendromus occidentalis]|uniref:Golgi resident protein GCP60 n=1 Tax=Galendromus occidentalis TaxID=34638 RepID=A0AAJ6QWA3_9ACAR|nr:Golgi resident protein GCP60 [Galendromus occidentalis]